MGIDRGRVSHIEGVSYIKVFSCTEDTSSTGGIRVGATTRSLRIAIIAVWWCN